MASNNGFVSVVQVTTHSFKVSGVRNGRGAVVASADVVGVLNTWAAKSGVDSSIEMKRGFNSSKEERCWGLVVKVALFNGGGGGGGADGRRVVVNSNRGREQC